MTSGRGAIQGGFRHVSVSHELHVLDMTSMTIRTKHEFTLKAIRPERFFERRFKWTGSGLENPPFILSGPTQQGRERHRLHGPVITEGTDRIFLIDLGRYLDIDEMDVVSFEHLFVDVEQTLEPFLGHTARMGCNDISLSVILPDRFTGTVRYQVHFANTQQIESSEILEPQEVFRERVRYRGFKKTVSNPQAGMNYRIAWPKTAQ